MENSLSDIFKNKKTVSQDEEIYSFQDGTGDAEFKVHKVFHGIDLVYNSVHRDKCNIDLPVNGTVIEIQHCREGRIEQQFGERYFYLMPGDLSVVIRRQAVKEYVFPLRHYHGISIVINTDIAPKCFSCFLKDVDVKPLNIANKLCGEENCFIIRGQSYIEHIFSELYSVPEEIKKGYFKIKIMELLLVLSSIDPKAHKGETSSLSQSQVQVAKEIAAYLAERTEKNISVTQLSEKFHISKSHLQRAFKGVYGTSVFSYIRILKMQAASIKLIQTNQSVLEIANEHGYDNPGKFAAAFKEIMGETPLEYRKNHSLRDI